MLKKNLFVIIACTTIHTNFTGGYWSQPENQVTLPDEKVLTERVNGSETSDFLKEIGFASSFAQQKLSLNQASQKIDMLFGVTYWNKFKSQIHADYQPEAKEELDEKTKQLKPILLTMLFKDFPEELKKIEEKK